MSLSKRKIVYLVIAAVLILLVVLAFLPDPLPVETAQITRGPMEVTIDEEGKTRVVDRFTITSPVVGRLQRIELLEGMPIERGQIVARIDPAPLDPAAQGELRALLDAAVNAQREAAASVQRAESEWELARTELRRIEALAAQGVISETQRDQARAAEEGARRELAAARARVSTAASNVEAARARLLSTSAQPGAATAEVRSPASGRILRIPDRSGRVVRAGEVILEIGDANRIELIIDVLSSDAVKIEPGNRVIVREWGGSEPLHGTVRLVEPSAFTKISALGIEEQRVNVIATVDDPPSALGDGYRIEASIVIWSASEVIRVPVSALGRHGDQWSVFLFDGDRAKLRPIRIGQRNSQVAAVLEGLEPGDRVIVHPSNDVSDGLRVEGGRE